MSGVASSKEQGGEIPDDTSATMQYKSSPVPKSCDLQQVPWQGSQLELGRPQAVTAVVDLNALALKGIFLRYLLCSSSPSERKPLSSLASPPLHPWAPCVYTNALEMCNTDWLGRTKDRAVSCGMRANSETGGGCSLTEHLHIFVLYNSPQRQENLAYLGTVSTSKMRCQFSLSHLRLDF